MQSGPCADLGNIKRCSTRSLIVTHHPQETESCTEGAGVAPKVYRNTGGLLESSQDGTTVLLQTYLNEESDVMEGSVVEKKVESRDLNS